MPELERDTQNAEEKMDQIIESFSEDELQESASVRYARVGGYWFDGRIGSATTQELEVLAKYTGGIYQDMLERNSLRLDLETSEILTMLLREARMIPEESMMNRFVIEFDYVDRGYGDTTTSITIPRGEFVFNPGLYPELDVAGLSLLNYPVSYRMSRYNGGIDCVSTINLPSMDERLRGLLSFRMKKDFMEQFYDLHRNIQSIKDVQKRKTDCSGSEIAVAEFLLDIVLSRR